ncbi:MAG: T9SS type A sorting domain-containing protein, partial [Sphingobacteriales bacterium]
EIERSGDGKTFSPLGSVAAANEAKAYQYEDYQYLEGNNYYRLKMVDQDGSFRYSPVVQAQMAGNDAAIKVFPNPASGTVFIQPASGAAGNLQLLDMNGRVVRKMAIAGKTELDLNGLPAGIYQYRIIYAGSGQMQQGKLVKR